MADNNQNSQSSGQGAKPVSQLSWTQPTVSSTPKTGTPAPKPVQNNSRPKTSSGGLSSGVIIGFIIGIVIGFLIGWAWFGSRVGTTDTGTAVTTTDSNSTDTTGTTDTTSTSGTPTSVTSENASITVASTQTAGMTVEVSSISIDTPVWAVVYEDINGQPGKALGAARFTPDRTSGSIELLRSTLPNLDYYVGLVADTSDHTYSAKINAPITDAQGNRILEKFTAQ